MNPQTRTVGEEDSDGSYHVWVGPWHVHYPADGGRPRVRSGMPPETATVTADVHVAAEDGVMSIRHDGWIVRVENGAEPRVIPVKPRRDGTGGLYFQS